jgi:protein-L-isoaspartate(D-aspartate) O-methyltransferase
VAVISKNEQNVSAEDTAMQIVKMSLDKLMRPEFYEQLNANHLDQTSFGIGLDDLITQSPITLAMLSVSMNTDQAFKIGAGQTISQPYTVAYQTSLLHLKKGDKVLEIGTGSGYQTCILLEMGAKVFSIERQKELFDKTKDLLSSLAYSPKLFYGDGYKGLPSYAPFDKVLVTCGAPHVPEELLKQLKVGGVMVIPVGAGDVQIMTTILKTSETTFETHELKNFRFVPMLEHKEWGK